MYLINDLGRLIRGEHLIIYFGETKERQMWADYWADTFGEVNLARYI
jgi:hypothetical protein